MSDNELLWHSYIITQTMECMADPSKLRAVVELSDDISAVFPYLNAIRTDIMYNPGANSVTLRYETRLLTFYGRLATLAKVTDEEDAALALEWFRALVNETWARRVEITPRYERRTLLGPLDIYVLLPKLNCKQCGEATCLAFGAGLLMGRRKLAECSPLEEPAYIEAGRRLAELLRA